MAIIERLGEPQIVEALGQVVDRATPVALSCRIGTRWLSCHTRILRLAGEKLWLEYPSSDHELIPEITVGLSIGLSFKIKHHKHVFSAAVEAMGQFQLVLGAQVRALCVPKPLVMQRIQRRAYHRVDVPRNRSVLATFWRGGLADPPGDSATSGLVWEGWVTNISAGGFQVRTASQGAPPLEVNDIVGVRIDLGQEYEAIQTEAQFRQSSRDERGVTLLAFQFVGLNETVGGRETLHRLGRIVCEFQRLQGRRRATSVA